MYFMSDSRLRFLSLIVVPGLAAAQTPAVDVTEIGNWPSCAVGRFVDTSIMTLLLNVI